MKQSGDNNRAKSGDRALICRLRGELPDRLMLTTLGRWVGTKNSFVNNINQYKM